VSRRYLLLLSLALSLTLLFPPGRAEASRAERWLPIEPEERQFPIDDDGIICTSRMVWRNRSACPVYGPATTAARVASIDLPDPLPELAVVPLQAPEGGIVPFTYAQVIEDNAPVYSHPIEAAYHLPPKRRLGIGYIWVSVQGTTTYEGQEYYQINSNEYVSAEALSFYQPSAFQGVVLAEQPERPFAWVL
jgi:hypothetical protein